MKNLFFLLAILLLSACAGQKQNLNNDKTWRATSTPVMVPSVEILVPTKTVSPTPAPVSVTQTITQTPDCNACKENFQSLIPPSAPVWYVPVVVGPSEVPSSLFGPDIHPFSWTDSGSINVENQYALDPSTGEIQLLPTSTPLADLTYEDNSLVVAVSPNKNFSFECDQTKNETRFIRTVDNHLIGSSPTSCSGVDWAPDESAVAFITNEPEYGKGFVWSEKEKAPVVLGDDLAAFSAVRWSPDSKKILAQSSGLDLQTAVLMNEIFVFSSQGNFIRKFRVDDGKLLDGWLDWHTNEIIDVQFRDGIYGTSHMYYEWSQGILLGSWYASNNYPSESQEFQLSPDKRWQVLDAYDHFQDKNQPVYIYGLYDFQEKKGTLLSSGPDRQLQFLGWSKDSQVFHLVNRPANPSAVTSEEMPFGWLELNPETMAYTPIFLQALFVKYNLSENLAWVVLPAKQADGTPGMDGAIYHIDEKKISDRHFIAKTIFYQNPAHGDLTPVEWSHDGKKIVYLDQEGNLMFLNIDGQKTILGNSLLSKEQPSFTDNLYQFVWSPDDRWLIVHGDMIFWILDLRNIR